MCVTLHRLQGSRALRRNSVVSLSDVPDPYAVLGVQPGASDAEIRAAYRDLARQHHPDRSGSAGAARMASINAAWAVLGDLESRRQWDRERATGRQPNVRQSPTGPSSQRRWGFAHEWADLDDLEGPDADMPVGPARRVADGSTGEAAGATGPGARRAVFGGDDFHDAQVHSNSTLAEASRVFGVVLLAVGAMAGLYFIILGAHSLATVAIVVLAIGTIVCALNIMAAIRGPRRRRERR